MPKKKIAAEKLDQEKTAAKKTSKKKIVKPEEKAVKPKTRKVVKKAVKAAATTGVSAVTGKKLEKKKPKISAKMVKPAKEAVVQEIKPEEIKKVIPPAVVEEKAAPVKPEVRPPEKLLPKEAAAPKQKIVVNETVTVKELAEKMHVGVGELIKKLFTLGAMATINQRLDRDTLTLAAGEYGFEVELVALYGEEMLETEKDFPADLKPRSPVVTIMGHVDHGKTSLLDAIRETRVAEKEAGGITQHIGAYRVETSRGAVVFLDTPGHEAFSAMRARGAQVTDIVVLVVAADDGVMPQTMEAIDHARAAGVPILVAINKIDLPQANSQRIKQELGGYNLVPEEWGGQTIYVEVSAKKKTNIDKLLEMIVLQSEILELKANPNTMARGLVVEARIDSQRGPVATVLIQKGTLHLGEAFVCGRTAGKIRAILDDRLRRIKEAGPSTPVEILGFSSPPNAGDRFGVVKDEREARHIAERREELFRQEKLDHRRHLALENVYQQIVEGKLKELKIILKADVRGSVEALKDSLEKLSTAEVKLTVIHSGVGGVKESDVILAAASNAIIIGFNVRPEMGVETMAQREGISIKTYRIIYEVLSDIRAAMEGLLEPLDKEVTLGRAEIREVFRVPKFGTIAGSYVIEGKLQRSAFVRVLRNNAIVFEGKNASLKRFKEDVREVEKGFECGIAVENFQDLKKGDVLEFYIQEKVARKLEA
ncbi:MAG: translation initiation factor IF-2 [Elusimicrobiota bacterium]